MHPETLQIGKRVKGCAWSPAPPRSLVPALPPASQTLVTTSPSARLCVSPVSCNQEPLEIQEVELICVSLGVWAAEEKTFKKLCFPGYLTPLLHRNNAA